MKTGTSITRTFFILSLLVSSASIFVVVASWLFFEYNRLGEESQRLREEYIESQKDLIRGEVEKVIDHIDYYKSLVRKRLEDSIKERVYEAHSIATNLYNEYRDSKSLEELKKLIRDALRPIRFNNGRGYYFATSLEGIEELFADRPETEGTYFLDVQDARGAYIIKDMIAIVETSGEGFYEYRWTKPKSEGKDFPKIAFIKHFEPFDWFIGTGEYLDDVEEDVRQELLERIAKIRFGDDGYIFVVRFDGITLMNDIQPELIGQNLWEMTDPNGVKVIQEQRKAIENPDGGYISYVWNRPTEKTPSPKISFMKAVHDWEWMVGAGIYVDAIEEVIADRAVALRSELLSGISRMAALAIVVFAFVFLAMRYFSKTLEKEFAVFGAFFEEASQTSAKVDPNELHFVEFQRLAEPANKMVDQRRDAEDVLRKSEKRFRDLAEMLPELVYEMDAQGRVLFVNKQALELTGYTEKDLTEGFYALDIFVPSDRASARENLERILKGEVLGNSEYTLLKKDGGELPVVANSSRIIGPEGVVGIRGIITDVSALKRNEEERRNLEGQVQHKQKLESLGVLAGGIAHDFNNILMAILGNADLAKDEVPRPSMAWDCLNEIDKASHRAANLCQQMLAYSGMGRFVIELVDIRSVIEEMLQMLAVSISKKIELQLQMEEDLPAIEADGTQIRQIILNLITNASEAIGEESGVISIRAAALECDKSYLQSTYLNEDLPEGLYVYVEVTDTGCGMDEDTKSKLFEPFYSTKFTGRGLGMAAVLGIVRGHKGAIQVKSEVGGGTTFRVLFPASSGTAKKEESEINGEDLNWRGEGTVLLVDDEETIRSLGTQMLQRLGFEVVTAADGREAVDFYHDHQDSVVCVLLDLTMPRMDGGEAFRELRRIRKDLPVILSSGYSEHDVTQRFEGTGVAGFIQKPYEMDALKRILSEVLEGRMDDGVSDHTA